VHRGAARAERQIQLFRIKVGNVLVQQLRQHFDCHFFQHFLPRQNESKKHSTLNGVVAIGVAALFVWRNNDRKYGKSKREKDLV
jgi:hypothetical protein